MSHSTKIPSITKSTSGLPTDVEDGTTAYDTTQNTLVVRVGGAWEKAGGAGATTPTVVYDDGASVGNTDQIQGDIPNNWKRADSSLKGLVIGTSCTSIGYDAFFLCTDITGSLVIPNSVTSISDFAFSACFGINGDLIIPGSISYMGSSVFSNIGINNVTIMNGAVIGYNTFSNCSSLTNIDCYVEKSVLDVNNSLRNSGVTTIHVRSTDSTWTAGTGQTIGGKSGIEVIKDL